jgi:hypothetical protein
MKHKLRKYLPAIGNTATCCGAIALLALGMTETAWAQLAQVNNVATAVLDTMKAGGTAVAASACAVSGYKVAFQGARFEDVSKVLIGGTLIGGSTAAAGWLMSAAS